jgi:transcription initiation factor TFIIA large subunit
MPQDDEAINSDLDDSSTEDEEDADEGALGETDIVFCTYDKVPSFNSAILRPTQVANEGSNIKVARVKNKWKCVLKDGMIHINGKDYLFAKCSGYVTGLSLLFTPLTVRDPKGSLSGRCVSGQIVGRTVSF